jgi:hypothetical protein
MMERKWYERCVMCNSIVCGQKETTCQFEILFFHGLSLLLKIAIIFVEHICFAQLYYSCKNIHFVLWDYKYCKNKYVISILGKIFSVLVQNCARLYNHHKTKSCKSCNLCQDFDKFDFMVLKSCCKYTSLAKNNMLLDRVWTCLVLGIWAADIKNAGLTNGWEMALKGCKIF